MVDNPKKWMADNPSVEPLGTERIVIGATATPNSVEAYSQRFEGGELIKEDRDIFLNNKEIIENISPSEKIKEITDGETKGESEDSQQKPGNLVGINQDALDEEKDNKKNFTQHHQIPPKK